MLPRHVSSLFWRRFYQRNTLPSDELDSFPRLPINEQRRRLGVRLLDQIRYFGAREDALPEWRELAGLTDPEALWRIWPSLPVMDKRTLTDKFPASEIGPRFGLTGHVRSTGGSTGEPTRFFHDEQLTCACNSASLYAQRQIGWRPGMATIKIWGSERDIGKATSWYGRASNFALNVRLVDGYALSEQTADQVAELVRTHRKVAITGFSSMLSYVAESLSQRHIVIRDRVVAAWGAGEMLLPKYRSAFRSTFNCPILDLYGGRELSTIAFQRSEHGPLNIVRPWLFVELLDENGRPVAPGETGRVVCTSTVSRGTPFIRYDIGDLGVAESGCYSEAGLVALSQLLGRSAGLFQLPDGRTINNLYWNHLFKDIDDVEQFQVVIESQRQITLLLKGRQLYSVNELDLLQTIHRFLGPGVEVSIRWVDAIPRTSQGKLVQVVRRSGIETDEKNLAPISF
jgi:phenylacetate-CoA ligase